jgi:hypothetical protein
LLTFVVFIVAFLIHQIHQRNYKHIMSNELVYAAAFTAKFQVTDKFWREVD